MVIWDNIFKIVQLQKQILSEMTSTTTMALKTGKKNTQTLTTTMAIASPTTQKTIEETLTGEKQPTVTNANLQATLLSLQESISRMQEIMIRNHNETRADISELKEEMGKLKEEMRADIQKVEDKVGTMQLAMERTEIKIKEIERRTERVERNLERTEEDFKNVNREMEDSLVQLEMDRAAAYLRFQNVEESKNEELEQLMAGLLAELVEKEKDDILKEFDEVYRVNTSYARRHNCPREIHIRFSRRCVRDLILRMARDERILYKGKEIIVLKQIPRRVRAIRQEYKFLANYLNKKEISFKWLIPEGMLISWKGRKIKIDSIEQAQDFLEQLTTTEDQHSREETQRNMQEDLNRHRNKEERPVQTQGKDNLQQEREETTTYQLQEESRIVTRQKARQT